MEWCFAFEHPLDLRTRHPFLECVIFVKEVVGNSLHAQFEGKVSRNPSCTAVEYCTIFSRR